MDVEDYTIDDGLMQNLCLESDHAIFSLLDSRKRVVRFQCFKAFSTTNVGVRTCKTHSPRQLPVGLHVGPIYTWQKKKGGDVWGISFPF